MTAPEVPHADLMSDQEMAGHQMRETAQYIDEYGKAPDNLAEFLRHWTVVLLNAIPPTVDDGHADLIARLTAAAYATLDQCANCDCGNTDTSQADFSVAFPPVLAALGDTVPRTEHDRLIKRAEDAGREGWSTALLAERDTDQAQRERDEARAERDALAHVVEQVRQARDVDEVHGPNGRVLVEISYDEDAVDAALRAAPAVSLAQHNAEVKAQALDEARQIVHDWAFYHAGPDGAYAARVVERLISDRAALIRDEAGL